MRTLGDIIETALETGSPQRLSREERDQFDAERTATVFSEIESLRAARRRTYGECRGLNLD